MTEHIYNVSGRKTESYLKFEIGKKVQPKGHVSHQAEKWVKLYYA